MDTAAILEAPDTAAPPEATDEQPLVPDSAEGQAATDPGGETEPTDSGSDEPSPWAGKTPEEIEAEVERRVRAVEARKEESFRQQRENERRETERKLAQQQADRERGEAQQVIRGQAYRTLEQMARQTLKEAFDAGKGAPDQNALALALRGTANQISQATSRVMLDQLRDFGFRLFESDYRDVAAEVDTDMARQFQHAFNTGDLWAAFTAHSALVRSAERAKARREAAAAATQAAAKPQEQKPKAAAGTVSPTRVDGGAGSGRNAQRVLETAKPGSTEYRRAFKDKYGFDP